MSDPGSMVTGAIEIVRKLQRVAQKVKQAEAQNQSPFKAIL